MMWQLLVCFIAIFLCNLVVVTSFFQHQTSMNDIYVYTVDIHLYL